MTRTELTLRTAAIALAVISPIICIWSQGLMFSYSQYWSTPMQPLFITANAITAYYFFDLEKWKMPAFMLLLLTAFSVESYSTLHNVLAVAFFITSLVVLAKSNHFKWIVYAYLASLGMLWYNMMIAETLAITVLALYHGLVLYKIKRIQKQKQIQI